MNNMQIKTEELVSCPICETPIERNRLSEAYWLPPLAVTRLMERYPGWELSQGACPDCAHRTLLEVLHLHGDGGASSGTGTIDDGGMPGGVPLEHGILPTPLRLHANPRYAGRGVVLAMVDSAFYPHPDLVLPRNRIRAWVDATTDPPHAILFGPDETPQWPGWDSADASQWHGMMTSTVAAGNGWLSSGLYRGLASEADLVLVQTRGVDGIGNENIARALRWILESGSTRRGGLGVRVVSISVAGRRVDIGRANPVDEAVAALVREGIVVVAAAGNDGLRRLVPPATAREALTVGGIDDRNNFDPDDATLWHSNYGGGAIGVPKPELVAPSIWVVAPVLPGSEVAREAEMLFHSRPERNVDVEARIAQQKLVTPHYQHVDGTSFAAPIVSSTAACMLEANPKLMPWTVREILTSTAQLIEGVERDRQGAGVLVPRKAIGMALRSDRGPMVDLPLSPEITPEAITFWLHEPNANRVCVFGSWDNWSEPLVAEQVRDGVWRARLSSPPPGEYTYRYRLDERVWLDDPDNPRRRLSPAVGSFDSMLTMPDPTSEEEKAEIGEMVEGLVVASS